MRAEESRREYRLQLWLIGGAESERLLEQFAELADAPGRRLHQRLLALVRL